MTHAESALSAQSVRKESFEVRVDRIDAVSGNCLEYRFPPQPASRGSYDLRDTLAAKATMEVLRKLTNAVDIGGPIYRHAGTAPLRNRLPRHAEESPQLDLAYAENFADFV